MKYILIILSSPFLPPRSFPPTLPSESTPSFDKNGFTRDTNQTQQNQIEDEANTIISKLDMAVQFEAQGNEFEKQAQESETHLFTPSRVPYSLSYICRESEADPRRSVLALSVSLSS